MEESVERRLVVKVSCDENQYYVEAPAGSNAYEIVFGLSVVIRCLQKDGFFNTVDDAIDKLKNYCTDVQFEEVEKNEQTPQA